MLVVISLSLLGSIVLSLVGPIYYDYPNGQYYSVFVWALACAAILLWQARPSIRHALNAAPSFFLVKPTLAVAIIAAVALAFVAGDSLAYWLTLAVAR